MDCRLCGAVRKTEMPRDKGSIEPNETRNILFRLPQFNISTFYSILPCPKES